jgi:hypothetical protein
MHDLDPEHGSVRPVRSAAAVPDPQLIGTVEPSDSSISPSVAELASLQSVLPVVGLDDLAGEWPDVDSLDEFLDLVHKSRE